MVCHAQGGRAPSDATDRDLTPQNDTGAGMGDTATGRVLVHDLVKCRADVPSCSTYGDLMGWHAIRRGGGLGRKE